MKPKPFTSLKPKLFNQGLYMGLGGHYGLIDCVNCGKQNLVMDDDPYNVKCEFGKHPVRIVKG